MEVKHVTTTKKKTVLGSERDEYIDIHNQNGQNISFHECVQIYLKKYQKFMQ